MSDPAAINYQPLTDMKHAFHSAYRASLKDFRGLAAFVLLIIIVPLAVLVLGRSLSGLASWLLYVLFLANRAAKYRDHLWEAFAEANGWTFDTDTPPGELVPPSMHFSHNPGFSPVILAQLGDLPCDLFTYHTTVGQGRNQVQLNYTVARVPLPKVLPHMLLLSKKAHARLERDLVDKQDIHLEGDFDDYFSLQIEQGQQIDVLTVITPDVMQTLVQYGQAEDIEILGTDMYFILSLDRRDLTHTEQLIQSVVTLSGQITQNISLEQGAAATAPPPIPVAGTMPPATLVVG